MPKLRHPLSGSVYDEGDDGLVVVEKDGRTGRFDRDGRWIDGEVRTADPELCRWLADPRPGRGRATRPDAASGPVAS